MANPQCKIEQRTKAIPPCSIALDLAANVADDAAKSRAQEFELPPSALELVGMRIAPHHNGRAFGHAQITLAQLDALAFGHLDELLDRPVGEPRIGRMRNRLLLHGGVHHHALQIFALDRPRSDAPPKGSPAAARQSAPRPVAVASALTTSDRTAPRGGTPLRRRSTENTGSPPTGRTASRRRDCACA